jgi:hypothetical protein
MLFVRLKYTPEREEGNQEFSPTNEFSPTKVGNQGWLYFNSLQPRWVIKDGCILILSSSFEFSPTKVGNQGWLYFNSFFFF